MSTDERGWRIALVPDALLNPPQPQATGLDLLGALEASGYGVLHLPPPGGHALLLDVIADQIAEYAHHGYAIVAVAKDDSPAGLHWRRLTARLRRRHLGQPARHVIRHNANPEMERQRLNAFLARHTPSIEIDHPEQ